MLNNNQKQLLKQGLQQLKVEADETLIEKFSHYEDMLLTWNKKINLTAIIHPQDIMIQHFFDSLSIAPFIEGENILDIGSGAGFPGMPLALVKPQQNFFLLESNQKKASFLRQLSYELQCRNVTVVEQRAEKYHPEISFGSVLARAVADLSELIHISNHLWGKTGKLLAMKSKLAASEIEKLPHEFLQIETFDLEVPFYLGTRILVQIKLSPK